MRTTQQMHDPVVESWLHDQAGPAYDALKADPTRALSIDQVRARLRDEHARASGSILRDAPED